LFKVEDVDLTIIIDGKEFTQQAILVDDKNDFLEIVENFMASIQTESAAKMATSFSVTKFFDYLKSLKTADIRKLFVSLYRIEKEKAESDEWQEWFRKNVTLVHVSQMVQGAFF